MQSSVHPVANVQISSRVIVWNLTSESAPHAFCLQQTIPENFNRINASPSVLNLLFQDRVSSVTRLVSSPVEMRAVSLCRQPPPHQQLIHVRCLSIYLSIRSLWNKKELMPAVYGFICSNLFLSSYLFSCPPSPTVQYCTRNCMCINVHILNHLICVFFTLLNTFSGSAEGYRYIFHLEHLWGTLFSVQHTWATPSCDSLHQSSSPACGGLYRLCLADIFLGYCPHAPVRAT